MLKRKAHEPNPSELLAMSGIVESLAQALPETDLKKTTIAEMC